MNIPAVDFPTQIKRGVSRYAKSFEFTLLNGAGATGSLSTPGAQTVLIAPVPLGINGTDVYHYLRISGGTGTAETVLITGGTAVAGAASGTLTFTTVNSHDGAWKLESATAGAHEALIDAVSIGGPATIILTASNQIWYESVHFQGASYITIEGNGAIIDFRSSRSGGWCFYNSGVAGITTTVSSNVNGGGGTLLNDTGRAFNWTNTLNLTSASGMAVGDYLWLQYNDAFKAGGGTQHFTQTVKIAAIVGDVVTTVDPIVIPINTALAASVQRIVPVIGNCIRNLIIDGTNMAGGTNSNPIDFLFHAETVIDNVTIRNVLSGPSSGGGLVSYIGYRNRYTNIRLDKINTQGAGADMLLYHETALQMSNIDSDRGSFGPTFVCMTVFDISNIRSLASTGRAMKLEACCWGKMVNVEASRASISTGFSIQAGTYQVQVTNLVCNYNAGVLGWGFAFQGGGSIYNTFTNVTSIGNNGQSGGGVSNDAIFGTVGGYLDTHNSVINILLNETDAANSFIYDQAGGNTVQYADNTLAGTAVAGAVTANSAIAQITTESLTTAAGATYSLTFTNNRIIGVSKSQVIVSIATTGSNNQGIPMLQQVTPSGIGGSATIIIRNMHASQAFNGTLVLNIMVVSSS